MDKMIIIYLFKAAYWVLPGGRVTKTRPHTNIYIYIYHIHIKCTYHKITPLTKQFAPQSYTNTEGHITGYA
jgi:hypothetical protein